MTRFAITLALLVALLPAAGAAREFRESVSVRRAVGRSPGSGQGLGGPFAAFRAHERRR
jgi:hypothetical protein